MPSLSFVELLILPGSKYIGKTLRSLRLMTFEGAYPLAIKKRKNIRNSKERLIRKSVNKINLKPGDRLLLEMQENSISKLHNIENTAILNQHEFTSSKSTLQKSTALVILLLMVGLAASGVLTILTASLTGVAAMLLTKSISLEDIYHKINWQIIFLLAGYRHVDLRKFIKTAHGSRTHCRAWFVVWFYDVNEWDDFKQRHRYYYDTYRHFCCRWARTPFETFYTRHHVCRKL